MNFDSDENDPATNNLEGTEISQPIEKNGESLIEPNIEKTPLMPPQVTEKTTTIETKESPSETPPKNLEKKMAVHIFAVKVAVGHEKIVADLIANKAKRMGSEIYSILVPTKLRGYLLIESSSIVTIQRLVKNVQHIRGVVQGTTPFSEISHFLTPKPIVSGITEGSIVELISGPFKGEKARVRQIDKTKEEITVEMFESMVPIPVTVRADHVRVLEKEKEEKGEK
jgi:transcriptional antiterminator NusG